MIINLIDSRSGNNSLYAARHSGGTSHPRNGVSLFVYNGETLSTIVQRVITTVYHPRSIWLLRIMGHGNYGYVAFGRGYLNSNSCREFKELRNYFTPGGIGIAVHSCGPASRTSICRKPEGWLEQLTAGENVVL